MQKRSQQQSLSFFGTACGKRHNQPATYGRRRSQSAVAFIFGWKMVSKGGAPFI
jgi:hypothetical protein